MRNSQIWRFTKQKNTPILDGITQKIVTKFDLNDSILITKNDNEEPELLAAYNAYVFV